MASACALAIFSGKNIFIFVVQKRLRAFLNHFFTRRFGNELPPVAYGDIFPRPGKSSLWGGAFGIAVQFPV